MSRRAITMSRLPIVVPCPSSWALPHVTTEAGAPAKRGSAIHAFLAAVSEIGREKALASVPEEYQDACEAIDTERLPTHLAPEVAFLLDLETGEAEELGRDIDRRYPADLGPMQIVGTADLVGIDEGSDAVVVYDYKTGWAAQEEAGLHWQIKSLALAAARAYGQSAARIGIIRVPETGRPSYDVAELDAFDLDAIEAELRRTLEKVAQAREAVEAGRTPDVHMGSHCRHCPAAYSCPGQVGLLRAVAVSPDVAEPALDELTPELAAEAYRRSQRIEEMLKRLRAQLEGVATRAPIPLGNGRELGPVTMRREKLFADVALPILREHYGEGVAKSAVELTTSKSAIRDALRPYAKRIDAKITHLEKEALELIRAADGVQVTESTRIAERKIQKEEAA